MTSLEWFHHPINVLAFRRSYTRFWSLAPQQRATETPPVWLALYTTVLCLSLHFRRTGELEREESLLQVRFQSQVKVPTMLKGCQAAQVALSLSNFVFEHSLEAIATIILMGLWLYSAPLGSALSKTSS